MARIASIELTQEGPVRVKPVIIFDGEGLHHAMRRNVELAGFVTPTPIQMYCLPATNDGHNVIGVTQTGSGKTAADVVLILNKLTDSEYIVNQCTKNKSAVENETTSRAVLASQEILGNCGLFSELGLGKTMSINLEEPLLKLPRSTTSSGYGPYWTCWRNSLANYNSQGIVPLSRCSAPFMVSDERLLWHLRLAFAHQLAAAERCKVSHVLPDHTRCGKPDERAVSGLPAGLVQQGYNLCQKSTPRSVSSSNPQAP
ncbi:uncharacterized protein E0L32_009798 [Thyridium curvatum]|uniref:DEAD-box RNA helicase Q domain-containing protein n=1 Tax=Thyridium curvatum TaxID=1093900 RepID=A0A507APT4_9PEZI|nr:uncharacterized protein E0L32_009798 [Thyridium curvatum]TPX08736.1 hypothetical protein E0L32_009798 [Thyridium curvatum]